MRTRVVAVIALALAGCGGAKGAVESPAGPSAGAVLPYTAPASHASPTPGLDVTPTAGAADQRRADRVARRFVRAYLAFTYRSDAGLLRRAPATPELVASLVASPPDIPAEVRRRSPRIVAVKLSWQGPARASALVTVDDGASRYPVAVQLEWAGSAIRVVGMEP